jgi:hypothetical protein
MDFQDGSGPKGIKWNRFGPLADQLETKQTNSINCTIAFKFSITKKTIYGTQKQKHSATKILHRKIKLFEMHCINSITTE